MDFSFFEKLNREGIIGQSTLDRIRSASASKPYSIQWELNIMLYLGVLLLCTGLGILVYENIDSIGHTVILVFIGLTSAGGYYYCYLKKLPFSTAKVASSNIFLDYLLVLSCFCLLIFLSYWQYQYHIFGERYGLATFIPMAILFFTAYYFDHLGILCLAIINLAAWAGIVVTPARIWKGNDFNRPELIYTGLTLGLVFMLASRITLWRKFKEHFAFTYANFGMNMLFLFCLAGLFHFDHLYLLWFLFLMAIAYYFYRESISERSFYFLLMLSLYVYVGLTYVVFRLPIWDIFSGVTGDMLGCIYFIISGIFLARFLIGMNRKFNAK